MGVGVDERRGDQGSVELDDLVSRVYV
jgi:hypothetical protein